MRARLADLGLLVNDGPSPAFQQLVTDVGLHGQPGLVLTHIEEALRQAGIDPETDDGLNLQLAFFDVGRGFDGDAGVYCQNLYALLT